MSQYTTGEIAKRCKISVRTVQFYDAKGLLKPTKLTEGGRRLYSEDDLNTMRLICMLKFLGLSLNSIKGLLSSKSPQKVLTLLLDEQSQLLKQDIADKQKQLETISLIKERIRESNGIPVDSIDDIEQLMSSKKELRKMHTMMLILGVIMDIIQLGALILWIATGVWLPFVIGIPFVILLGILMTWIYFKNTNYICPECNTSFKPSLKDFLFSKHTPKTRKLKCPHCHYHGYCIEIAFKKG